MMRNGILLAEDTPVNIMQKYGCENLEEAFLILSQKQGKSEEADTTLGRVSGQKMVDALEQQNQESPSDTKMNEKEKEASQKAEGVSKSDAAPEVTKSKLRRNISFRETKPLGLIGKLTFTSQIRMKALLMKNLLQLIRQPS